MTIFACKIVLMMILYCSEVEQQEKPAEKEGKEKAASADAGQDDVAPVHGQEEEDLGRKVTAGANYLGSVLTSAWSKTAKTANEATASGSSFFTSALSKVTSPTSEEPPEKKEGEGEAQSGGGGGLLTNAFGGLGLSGKEGEAPSLGDALATLGKATQSLKEKVGTTNMIAEFNKEQASFIKNKGTSIG